MNRLCVLSVVLLSLAASAAWAQRVELYSAEPALYQYFGTGALGKSRSQHFSPTTSTPNSLSPSDTFVSAGAYVRMGTTGESANVTLRLYEWNTDYDTTIIGPILAGPVDFDITSFTPQWIELTSTTPLAASESYLLRCTVNSMTYVSAGFGIWKSGSDDGGPGNDAYNDNSIKTDREYQVRLTVPPATAVEQWELYE